MVRNSRGHQACAVCKHQRKGCSSECKLAPYFPVEKARSFKAVLKVFGVSNVSKMMDALATDAQRSEAARAMMWEAECRTRNPVHGCWGEYKKLLEEVKMLKTKIGGCPMCNGSVVNQQHPYDSITRHHHNNNNNGNIIDAGYINNNSGFSLPTHDTSYFQGLDRGNYQGRDLPLNSYGMQQYSMDGFQYQHYFIRDQFNQNFKPMDSGLSGRRT